MRFPRAEVDPGRRIPGGQLRGGSGKFNYKIPGQARNDVRRELRRKSDVWKELCLKSDVRRGVQE